MSKTSLVATALCGASLISSHADILISQYYEGTSFNKFVELHNPTAADVTLTGYRLTLWTNSSRENWKTDGSTPSNSLDLSGVTIPAGGYYLLGHPSATIPSYATPNGGNSNIINFNGDDSVVLYKSNTYTAAEILDAISISATLQGQDKSFYRLNNEVGYTTVSGENITAFVTSATPVWGEKSLADVAAATTTDPWYLASQAAPTHIHSRG